MLKALRFLLTLTLALGLTGPLTSCGPTTETLVATPPPCLLPPWPTAPILHPERCLDSQGGPTVCLPPQDIVDWVEWSNAAQAYYRASLSCPSYDIAGEAPLARVIRTGHPYGRGIQAVAQRIVEGQ